MVLDGCESHILLVLLITKDLSSKSMVAEDTPKSQPCPWPAKSESNYPMERAPETSRTHRSRNVVYNKHRNWRIAQTEDNEAVTRLHALDLRKWYHAWIADHEMIPSPQRYHRCRKSKIQTSCLYSDVLFKSRWIAPGKTSAWLASFTTSLSIFHRA